MAAPAHVTLGDMSGRWSVNQLLSDSFDDLLALQGIPWWKRQASHFVTLSEIIKQSIDDAGITHVNVNLKISGGFNGGAENRVLDWKEYEFVNESFGSISKRSKWIDLAALNDDFLKEAWSDADAEKAGPAGEKHILVSSSNEVGGWAVQTVSGFAEVVGKRYHVRRVVCKKGDKIARVRGVYDWHGRKWVRCIHDKVEHFLA